MAETKEGNKFVVVPAYTRQQGDKVSHVPKHVRPTPAYEQREGLGTVGDGLSPTLRSTS